MGSQYLLYSKALLGAVIILASGGLKYMVTFLSSYVDVHDILSGVGLKGSMHNPFINHLDRDPEELIGYVSII